MKKDMEQAVEVVEDEFQQIKCVEDIYAMTMESGDYTYRLRRLKNGKEYSQFSSLYMTPIMNKVNAGSVDNIDTTELFMKVFSENYDECVSYVEWSKNGKDYNPLYVKEICQHPDFEFDFVEHQLVSALLFKVSMAFISFSQSKRQGTI